MPQTVVSDRGGEFANTALTGLEEFFLASHHYSTPYIPKGHGLVENKNKEINKQIRKMLKKNLWPRTLPLIALNLNNVKDSTLKFTPNEIIFGRNIPLAYDSHETYKIADVGKYWELIKNLIRPSAYVNLVKSRQKQADFFNKKYNTTDMVLEPGTLVFVQKRKLNFKHDTPFDGPFEVVKLVP
eukprot:Nk52_evm1s1075 gene=Nk52_evmTU1s1075